MPGIRSGEEIEKSICEITTRETLEEAINWYPHEALDAAKDMIENSKYYKKVKTKPENLVSEFIEYLGEMRGEYNLNKKAIFFLNRFEKKLKSKPSFNCLEYKLGSICFN